MCHLLLILLLLSAGLQAEAASFDCSKAVAQVERAICADPGVSELDARLGKVYRQAREALSGEEADGLKRNQRAWLARRNQQCGPDFTAECLSEWYSRRIAVLELLSSPDFLSFPAGRAAGEYAMGEEMSLHVEALAPRQVAVQIDGAEFQMARWICEFSGSGKIDDQGLAQIKDPDTGKVVDIAFSNGTATVDAPDAATTDYCGMGGTLNGHYARVADALQAPGAQASDNSDDLPEDPKDVLDYQTPLPLVRLRAEQGNAAAQNDLAGRFAVGNGVPQDAVEAVKWYRKAAAQGNPEAMYNLGFTYFYGKGVTRDRAEGMRWLQKASAIGFGQASLEIAGRYGDGDGTAPDLQRSMIWLRKAAYQGDRQAEHSLAKRYYDGDGVAKNLTEAAHWFRRAAEQNNAESQYALAVMYMKGEGVPRSYVQSAMWLDLATSQVEGAEDSEGLLAALPQVIAPAQAEKAKALADAWRSDHRKQSAATAQHGEEQPEDPWGQYINGTRYYEGRGGPQDRVEAARWFHKAAEQDDSASQYYLARMYMNGEGVPIDYVHAYMWLDLATVDPGSESDADGLREKLAQLMSASQIEKGKALADEWRADNRSRSAGSGDQSR